MTNKANGKDRTAVATRFVLLTVAALLMSGCMRSRQLENLCEEIADQCPQARFSKDISLSLGPVSLGLIRFATGFREDTREAREYLSGIDRIQLAIYKVASAPRTGRLNLPKQLREMVEEDGWEMVVKSTEKDETAWILFRENDGKIREMHITALDDHELVMVRVSGRLNDLFKKAIKEHRAILGKLSNKVGHKVPSGVRDRRPTSASEEDE